jgi:hypothetical protein
MGRRQAWRNPQRSTVVCQWQFVEVFDAFNCGITYLVDVLALELGDELVKALAVSLNADGLKDLLLWCQSWSHRIRKYANLDVAGRGRGVATEAEEEVCREVLHFDGL